MAVAAAIVLVVVLEGFKVGLWQQIRAYRQHLEVQLVAVPAGSSSTLQVRSAISPSVVEQVSYVPGVRRVYPLVSVPSIFVRGDKKTPIVVIGYDMAGGPWRLATGRPVGAPGEIVMDRSLAKKYGLTMGDQVTVMGKDFHLVGLSTDTASLLGSYVFVGLQDALALSSAGMTPQEAAGKGVPNLLLIEVVPDAKVSQVQDALEAAVPPVDVVTPEELASRDVAMVRELLGSVLNLMVGVAYVVGVLVIGLTLYASVLERVQEYGVMKALGARNGRLYRYVLGQGFIFTSLGFVLGIVVSLGVAALLTWLMPQYQVSPLDAQVLLRAAVAVMLMGAVASLLPIRQVAGVDPAQVFKR